MEAYNDREILRKPNELLREVAATAFGEAYHATDAKLDKHSATRESAEGYWFKRAISDAETVIQNHSANTNNSSTYSEVYDIALRSLEKANSVKGGPLENRGETVFYDVYLATLDSILEERNVHIIAPRNLRFFGEPKEALYRF